MAAASLNPTLPRTWPRWPYLTVLSILFLGPPVAALCIASCLPVLTWLGWLARDLLTTYVCPTPAKTYELLSAPMAVCSRCWGATIGLWLGWFISTQPRLSVPLQPWVALPTLVRFASAAIPFGLWWLEITYWPSASLGTLLLNGCLAGTSAGLFFCSVWPGLRLTTITT